MKTAVCTPDTGDIPKLKSLWQRSFGDTEAYIDLFFDDLFRPADAAVLYADGEPVSMAMLIPCVLSVGGEEYRISYLYAMCTDEGFRGRGLGLELLAFAAEYCRRRGDDGIALVPADEGLERFYAKAGYEVAFHDVPDEKSFVAYDDRFMRHIRNLEASEPSDDFSGYRGMLLRLNDRIPPDTSAYLQYPMN